MRITLFAIVSLVLSLTARAQKTEFVPNCIGIDDTTEFSTIISIIGSNTGTIRLPYKNGARCVINNLTIPANITLDNSDGTGIKVNTGQTLSIAGPLVNPPGEQVFYNALSGQGTVSFAGNPYISLLSPEWWGAKGDAHVTDDTTAINASLTAAGTPTYPAVVQLRSASYLCSSGLTVPSGVRFQGVGYGTELFFQNGAGIATGVGVSSASNVDIGYMRITGSGTSSLSRGVYITSSNNVRVHNLWVTGCTFTPVSGPLTGIGGSGSNDVWVTDNDLSGNGVSSGPVVNSYDIINYNGTPAALRIHFQRNRVHDSFCAYSIGMFDVSYADILDNYVDQNNKIAASALISSGYGIFVYQALVTGCDHVHVDGNTVKNTAGTGIYFAGVNDATVLNNITDTTVQQQTGTLPQGGIGLNSTTYVSVTGNVLLNSTKHGIAVSGTPNRFNAITGNSIQNAALDGININGLSESSVTGNPVDSPGNFCIDSISTFRNSVSGNPCRNSAQGAILITDDMLSVFAQNPIANSLQYGIVMTGTNSGTRLLSHSIYATGESNVLYQGILAAGTNLTVADNSITPFAATLTAATNASPIVVTTSVPHGLVTGQANVTIAGVVGNTAANGTWTITVTDSTHFSLNTSTGNGAYTGGGAVTLPKTTNALDTSSATDSTFHHNTVTGMTNGIILGGTRNQIVDNIVSGNTNARSGSVGSSVLRGNTYTTAGTTGIAVLVAGTVTVTTAEPLTGDLIRLSRTATGGTLGHLSYTIVSATSITITSSSNTDASAVCYEIVH